jgi:hypothetical protein
MRIPRMALITVVLMAAIAVLTPSLVAAHNHREVPASWKWSLSPTQRSQSELLTTANLGPLWTEFAAINAAAAAKRSAVVATKPIIAASSPSSTTTTSPPSLASGNDATSTGTPDWICIKDHESGDNYSEPGGGAFQFEDGTWQSITGLSGSAQDYPPAVQDAAALKLYSERGFEPWTTRWVCGLG